MVKRETKFSGEEIVTYFQFIFISIKGLFELFLFFVFFKN